MVRRQWVRRGCSTLVLASLGVTSAVATAAPPDDDRPVPPAREAPAQAERESRPIRIGGIAGVGFPRPFAFEALVKIEDVLALGVEYATMPTLTISVVDVRLWSVAGDVRLFPFKNALFIGVRGGRQHISSSTSLEPFLIERAQLAVDSWYVNPRIGLLWTTKFGLTLGTEAGVQVPFGAQVSSNIPAFIYNVNVQRVFEVANGFGKQVIPTFDVLRVGLIVP